MSINSNTTRVRNLRSSLGTGASIKKRALVWTVAGAVMLAAGGCISEGNESVALPYDTTRIKVTTEKDFRAAKKLARKAEKAKDPNKAIVHYQAAIARFPEFAAAWNNLGVIFLSQDRYFEAAEVFARAADLSPADPRPMFNLALTWDRARYYEDALDFYNQSLARDPNYLPAINGAVRAERVLNRASYETLERIRRALLMERDPKWREFLTFQRGTTERAIAESRGEMYPMSSTKGGDGLIP